MILDFLHYIASKASTFVEKGSYDVMYGMLDYNGRTVVDIGGGTGSTAEYFMRKGAQRVVVYERNPMLKDGIEFEDVVVRGAWQGEALPSADILKMDCDGCELLLTEQQLKQFPRWVVAVHKPPINTLADFWRMQNMLVRLGGVFVYKTNDDIEHIYVKR